MDAASYNENKVRQLKLRHLFYPGSYGLISESVIALLALILFNLNDFSGQLLGANLHANPFSLWYQPLRQLLNKADAYAATERITLFLLWAIVGALLYIFVFRLLQIYTNVKGSVGEGVELVRRDSERGLIRWLSSLHDFFVKALVALVGMAAIIVGAVVCFGIASQELRNGLIGSFPTDIGPFILSLAGALLSVRLIALGLTLSSRHFRNWYLY